MTDADTIRAEPHRHTSAANFGPETGGTLTIDLDAIEANWRFLVGRLTSGECAAVVKANGYGLGLEPITTKLAKAGCRTFFVADLSEARRARNCARDAAIYVLNGYSPQAAPVFADINARPVLNSMAEFVEWNAFAMAHDWHGGAALHIDTGMNRLGLSPQEAIALAPHFEGGSHGITLVMSHMASAGIPDYPSNARQIRQFQELRAAYRGIPASLANSSAIFLDDATHCEMARPGAALYGINPGPGKPNPMRNVAQLTGRILQVREVGQGETVGYDAAWTARRPSRIAVVALGYADGLLRSGSGTDARHGGAVVIAGRHCPIVGHISMDLLCADITEVSAGKVSRGDIATVIGDAIPVDDVAAAAGTISYEILTRLGPRCHVVYRG
jgi:alanine racemase